MSIVRISNGGTSGVRSIQPSTLNLAAGVRGAEFLARDAGGRGDRDDQAGALGHDRRYRTGDDNGPNRVVSICAPELLRGELIEEAGVEVASVVDQNVDASEPLERSLDGRVGVGRVGAVELDLQEVIILAQGRRDGVGVTCGSDQQRDLP